MNFKKGILAFCLIICILFSVSCVAAGDVDDVAMASENENQITEEASNDEMVASSQNEDVLGAKDDGTFTALQNKINNAAEGSSITLENDYKYNSGFDTNGIKISKNLTINGNGHTINGLSKSRIFDMGYKYPGNVVNEYYTVVLNNIKFINGKASGSGGAICIDSVSYYIQTDGRTAKQYDVKINNCVFTNNYATIEGGAINDDDSQYANNKLTISNSVFTSNKADDCGGAISTYGWRPIITNSKFYYNSAGQSGGAIYAKYGLSVSNSQFKSNVASFKGAALYLNRENTIDKCTFTSNKASSKDNGVIYIKGSSDDYLKITNSKFIDNYPAGKTAISIDGAKCSISNTVFSSTPKITLVIKAVKVKKSAKRLILQAALKKGKTAIKSKWVLFRFNGKTYKAKTNRYGIAKVIIKKPALNKLKVGRNILYFAKYGKLVSKRTTKVLR